MELMPQYDKAISQGGQDYVAHASSPPVRSLTLPKHDRRVNACSLIGHAETKCRYLYEFFDERPMAVVDNSHDAKMLWVQQCSDYSDQVIARRSSLYLQCHDKLSQIGEDKAY